MNVMEIEVALAAGPARVGIHSVEGFGKTTLAAAFPKPVFIATENGFPRDLKRRPHKFPSPQRWQDVLDCTNSLINDKHDFESLVIDTVDWMEPLIHEFVCKRDSGRKTEMNKGGNKLESIEDYGWGKGHSAVEEVYREYIRLLDKLQSRRNMHVVKLAHSQVVTFSNPAGDDFDRYQPKMHKKMARVFVEYCETLLFGFYEVATFKESETDRKSKGVSTGKRILGTRQTAMYDAKNRVGLIPEVELDAPEAIIPWLLGHECAEGEMPEDINVGLSDKGFEPELDAKPAPDRTLNKPKEEAKGKPESKGVDFGKRLKDHKDAKNGKIQPPTPPDTVSDGEAGTVPEEDPDLEGLQAECADLRERAKKKGTPFVKKVDDWISKAGNNTDRLTQVIARIQNELK